MESYRSSTVARGEQQGVSSLERQLSYGVHLSLAITPSPLFFCAERLRVL